MRPPKVWADWVGLSLISLGIADVYRRGMGTVPNIAYKLPRLPRQANFRSKFHVAKAVPTAVGDVDHKTYDEAGNRLRLRTRQWMRPAAATDATPQLVGSGTAKIDSAAADDAG